MNVALWVVQGIVASIFAYSGTIKATEMKEAIVARGQTGVSWYGLGFIRFIAVSELFGAAGLILPWLLGIARVLTPVAALCLSIIMVGAAVSHARLARANARRRLRESLNVVTNAVIFAGCIFVAVARFTMLGR